MMTMAKAEFDEVDRAALERALELTLAESDVGRVEQVRAMLAEDGWHYAATFAAYYRQCEHLQLSPWEDPPAVINEDEIDSIIARGPLNNQQFGGAKLLQKMLNAGLSPYDPQPITSLANKRG